MDLQEKFKQFLKEDSADVGHAYGRPMLGPPPGIPAIDDVVDGDPWNLQNPDNIQRLNGYLHAASRTPVINPYFLLKRVQDKLSQIGLQFELPKLLGDTGIASKPLTQFSGTYGYPKGTGAKDFKPSETGKVGFPEITKGDGIKDRIPGGLDIKIHWTCFKGLYTVEIELVPGTKPKREKIQEEENIDEKHIGFDKLANKLSHEKGITDPKGLAYAIGAKKYGKGAMAHAAHEHKPLHEDDLDECTCGKDDCVVCSKKVNELNQTITTGIKSAALKALKKHRKIDNPFSLAWYLKKHGEKSSADKININDAN